MVHVDTVATASHIREMMQMLDKKMISLNYDIMKFNEYIREQHAALAAHGETTTDLLTSLWRGYLACKDKAFLSYIERRKEDYE